jgi:signal transduction histidine kinase
MLSFERSVANAVEQSAKRQVYNLAYGLTHEINNPLGNIVARAQQMVSTASTDSDRKSLATIVDQGMRAHEMLAEVMRAVQPSPLHLKVEDVHSVVHSVWSSLHQQAETDSIRWHAELGHEPMYAKIDKPSLTEALRLIGQNALDVCSPGDSVIWSCEVLPTSNLTDAIPSTLGRVRINVRDTGPGLSPTGMRSAMDLFFSGREQGRGLGVSLAVVRRIVEAHAGTVAMCSEPNAGCSVTIELTCMPPPSRKKPCLQL